MSDVEEDQVIDAPIQGELGASEEPKVGQKRPRADDVVSLRTVLRWRGKDGINLEHILGCGEGAPPEERARCEEVLKSTGKLICILCNVAVSARKKAVKTHQLNNKKHVARLSETGLLAADVSKHRGFAVPPFALEGWDIIKNAGKVTNVTSLKKLLEDLGVYAPKDLTHCNMDELEEISTYLKTVPKRAFCKLFKLDKQQ
jgi:hypothetical protein